MALAETQPVANAVTAKHPPIRVHRTLEGMRGLGAIAVLLYHYLPSPLFPATYLAVDMFFLMSGLVLGERYLDDLRSGRVSAARFCLTRVIRVFPLYWLGLTLAVGIIFVGRVMGKLGSHHYADLFLSALPGIAMVPGIGISIWQFPLNIPAWSLCLELIVNFAFALAPYRFRTLIVLTAIGAIGLMFGAFTHQTLDLGSKSADFGWGLSRVIFSFYCGVILAKFKMQGRLPQISLPAWIIIVLFAATLCIPYHGPVAALLGALIVLFVYPALLCLAISSEPGPRLGAVMQWLGVVSFPLYAIHVPLKMGFVKAAAVLRIPPVLSMWLAAPIALGMAYLALEYFDVPVRRWLSARAKRYFAGKAPTAKLVSSPISTNRE